MPETRAPYVTRADVADGVLNEDEHERFERRWRHAWAQSIEKLALDAFNDIRNGDFPKNWQPDHVLYSRPPEKDPKDSKRLREKWMSFLRAGVERTMRTELQLMTAERLGVIKPQDQGKEGDGDG